MNELKRETLGDIWTLCDQMAYAAQTGKTETLRAQFATMLKLMARLDMIQEHIEQGA